VDRREGRPLPRPRVEDHPRRHRTASSMSDPTPDPDLLADWDLGGMSEDFEQLRQPRVA
jgi:hypothetical protein